MNEKYDELLRIVWEWIIAANDSLNADTDDLIHELTTIGSHDCPPDLDPDE